MLMAHGKASPLSSFPAIAIVDVQYILQNAQAAKNLKQIITNQRQTYADSIAQQERNVRTVEQEVSQQHQELSQEELIQKRHALEQQIAQIRTNIEQHRQQLNQIFTQSMSKIRETILTIIAEIAEERGLTLVLFKHQVIVFDQSLDLTQVVLEHLDESLPEIDHILSQIENLEQVSQTSSQ